MNYPQSFIQSLCKKCASNAVSHIVCFQAIVTATYSDHLGLFGLIYLFFYSLQIETSRFFHLSESLTRKVSEKYKFIDRSSVFLVVVGTCLLSSELEAVQSLKPLRSSCFKDRNTLILRLSGHQLVRSNHFLSKSEQKWFYNQDRKEPQCPLLFSGVFFFIYFDIVFNLHF